MPKLASLVSVLGFGLLSIACETEKRGAEPGKTAAVVAQKAPLAPPQVLSDFHHDQKVFCKDCHTGGLKPNDNESAENSACVGCHIADLTNEPSQGISPHKSHLGRVGCTACHHGHVASQTYCSNCHIFDFHVPFEGNVPVVVPNLDHKPKFEESTDVVIIGSGGTGLTAAITAHDLGVRVVVFEKQPFTGGNTMLAAGGMNAANTRFQQALGIVDSAELMSFDTLRAGQNANDPDLVRILATNSAASVDWLTALGADLSDVGKLAGSSVRRSHRPKGGLAVGAHLVEVLRANVKARALDVRVNSRVTKLVEDDTGHVVGVEVYGKHSGHYGIESKAVILATGGFSANLERVAFYRPEFAGMATSNQPGATGDGLDLGVAANGQLLDMAQIQIHPTLAAGSRILITEAVRGNGGILVNREGARFIDEMATRGVVSAAVLTQPGRSAFVVFDETVRQSLGQIEGYLELGLVKSGESLTALATTLGIAPAALEATVARYNLAYHTAPNRIDPDFQRVIPRPLETASYYAIEVAPGVHYTMGGLEIDTQTRVIGTSGAPIPGFYAAGEVTGGVHGNDRLGGNSISETITFGRIAGANAAAWARGVAPAP